MQLMQMTSLLEKQRTFAKRSAKAWQNYFDAQGLLPDISLSPEQISVVQQEEEHLLINGSAGSGKSLTLLYKLLKVMDQENEPKRILYCSYNQTLIEDARKRIQQSSKYQEVKDKHTVHLRTFHNAATEILQEIGFSNARHLKMSLRNIKNAEEMITRRTMVLVDNFISTPEYGKLPPEQKLYKTHQGKFLMDEVLWMKANGFITWEQYAECERAGRGANPRLTKEQRNTVFTLYKQYHEMLKEKFRNHLDLEDYALLLLKHNEEIPESMKYDYIFVDEVQDLQAMQLKSLIALQKKSIVVSGDPKQRIYKRSPFSYRELGLNIEGRKNRTLKTNYRSTKQIMQLAGRIQFDDEENDRYDDQHFVREGEVPIIRYFSQTKWENRYLLKQIKEIHQKDPGASIAVIHRHDYDANAARECPVYDMLRREFNVIQTNDYARRFDFNQARKPIFYTDAFSVKGLEFDYVFVIHFDRHHYPNEKRIEELKQRCDGKTNTDSYDKDYDDIFNDEKKLLYVAMTRAKKELQLLYTAAKPTMICQMIRDFDTKHYVAKDFNKSIYK
jgi:DNA helicase II / ATP-dependent DNA helicase PcrA